MATSVSARETRRPEPVYEPEDSDVAAVDDDEKPIKMEGWLEKKGHGKVMSNDWARRCVNGLN